MKDRLIRRVLVTFGVACVFVILGYIPLPFLRGDILTRPMIFNGLDRLWLFNGGPFSKVTLMGTGVSAYITASILVQFLMYTRQDLYAKVKLPGGQAVMKELTLKVGLGVAVIVSLLQLVPLVEQFDVFWLPILVAIPLAVAFQVLGTYIAIRLGFLIEDYGLGQGMSVLIAINILKSLPFEWRPVLSGSWLGTLGAGLILVITLVGLVLIETSEYVIPVVYSKSYLRGRRESDTWRFKLNPNGIMPLIVASMVLNLILSVINLVVTLLGQDLFLIPSFVEAMVLVILVVLFSHLYGFMAFDGEDLNQRLQSETGQIEGVAPGRETVQYLQDMNGHLTRISTMVLVGVIATSQVIGLLTGSATVSATSLMILIGVWLQLILECRSEWHLVRLEGEGLL